MKKLIIFLLIALWATTSNAMSEKRQLIYSFRDSLARTNDPRDSMRLMYNLFDLDIERHAANSRALLDLVSRHGEQSQVLNMIRVSANLNHEDSAYVDSLIGVVNQYAENPEVGETRLLLRLLRIADRYGDKMHNNEISRSDIAQKIVNYKKHRYTNQEERLADLFDVVKAVSCVTRGPLLASYIDSLQTLAEGMNLSTGGLRYYIYDTSAKIFATARNPVAAVANDKKLLNVMDSLARENVRAGRIYSSYPLYRYQAYRRLLRNASALNEAEIEQYYDEAKDLAANDSVIRADLASNSLLDIYYLMAKKEYAKAMPLLEKQIYNSREISTSPQNLYPLLYEVAKALGNREVMRSAAEVLYPLKSRELNEREQFRLNDMRILYQSDSIRASNAVMDTFAKERRDSEKKTHYIILAICLVALLFLALFILFLARQRSHILSMAEDLKQSNANLLRERNELRQAQAELIEARDASKAADRLKTDFINNMSHEIKAPLAAISEYSRLIVDCIPDDKRTYLDKFATIISINSRLILTLVNDVLDVASLERKEMSVSKEPVNVSEICEVALGNVFEGGRTAPDSPVQLVFEPLDPDVSVLCDPQRAGQVLTNLLSNAKKFTEKGTITLSYTYDPAAKTVTFSVADTGIGIPKGKEEEIFSRFRQLDHTVQGTGLGLYISRLLSDIQGGELKVDPDYRGGARFIFTIPTGF